MIREDKKFLPGVQNEEIEEKLRVRKLLPRKEAIGGLLYLSKGKPQIFPMMLASYQGKFQMQTRRTGKILEVC